MPTTKIINNMSVSAPFVTSAVQINAARSDAQMSLTITAPLDVTATLQLLFELSSNGTSGWLVQSSLSGAHGGTGKNGVSPATYGWSSGVTPEMIGKFVRLNFPVVTGTWILDGTVTT